MRALDDLFAPRVVAGSVDAETLLDRVWEKAHQHAAAAEQRLAIVEDLGAAILAFGLKYFPHYCALAPSRFHIELCAELGRVLTSPDGERVAIAAPRSNAKSTWVGLIFPIFCIVRELKRFIVLISDTSTQAEERLIDLRNELDTNEALAADYPDATGRGSRWKNNDIITANGIRVLALGSGKKIRGRKHGHIRPDLILPDDMENDENTVNKDQRDKLWNWLNKAVLKAKGVQEKCDVVLVGTVIHFDSVLARLMDVKTSPGWRSRKYQSVIRWSERQDLWDIWQAKYTDYTKGDDERIADAMAYLKANLDAMLLGTEVLWPEGEPYEQLMRLRIDEGPSAFDSEKQNEPIDPSSCDFPEEWFQWFDEERIDGEVWLVNTAERVRLADCDVFAAVDPSMGKRDKHRDPSAIVAVAAYPSQRLEAFTGTYRSLWVIDAQIKRRHPHVIQADLLDLHRLRNFERVGVEAIQFQELFAEHVQAAALEDVTVADLVIRKLRPHTDKKLRIQKLSPKIYSGQLRFSRKLVELYNQLRYFPQHAHDDGPDALELVLELMGFIGYVTVESGPDPKAAASDSPRSPARQQIERAMPEMFEQPSGGDTCAGCTHFQKRGDGQKGFCRMHALLTEPTLPGCEYFEDK